jgi:hypothetical protein
MHMIKKGQTNSSICLPLIMYNFLYEGLKNKFTIHVVGVYFLYQNRLVSFI